MVKSWLDDGLRLAEKSKRTVDHYGSVENTVPEKRARQLQLLRLSFKRRSKKLAQAVFVLMLIWCFASVGFIAFDLIRLNSPYKKTHVDQVFHVQMVTGWSHATLDDHFSEKLSHPFSAALHQRIDAQTYESVITTKTNLALSKFKLDPVMKKADDSIRNDVENMAAASDFTKIHADAEGKVGEHLLENSSADKSSHELQLAPQSSINRKHSSRTNDRNKVTNLTKEMSGSSNEKVNHTTLQEGLHCDRSHWRTDICFVAGDVRVKTKFIQLIHHNKNETQVVERIKPYTRKWEAPVMEKVDEVTIESLYNEPCGSISEDDRDQTISCSVKYSVPAVIFSTGGYSGNVYHDFNDGLIPLYLTTRHLQGEVVLLVLDYHTWWIQKYSEVLQQLSHYPIIDLGNDHSTVHCFSEVIAGLKIHNELSIDPNLQEGLYSMQDFRYMLQQAFIPSDHTIYNSVNNHGLFSRRPRLVLMARKRTSRSILNQQEVIALARRIGFQVKVLTPTESTPLDRIFRTLHSSDVMMGVHGAAMTHLLFLRPGSVFIQIIPLGTDYPALAYYGEPAKKLGLEYVEYKITAQESSLSQIYNMTDKVLTDPQAVASKGWPMLKKYYLQGQSVRVSLPRMRLTLQRLKRRIEHQDDGVVEVADS